MSLTYMNQAPKHFARWWIAGPLLLNGIAAALGAAILRYTEGTGGAFFPIETTCVLILAPFAVGVGVAAACGLWNYYYGSRVMQVVTCIVIVMISLGPLPLHFIVYHIITAHKVLNFGPG